MEDKVTPVKDSHICFIHLIYKSYVADINFHFVVEDISMP